MADHFFECLIVPFKFLYLFLREHLLRCAKNILLAKICNIAATIVLKLLVGWLYSLHYVLLFTHYLDMLLSNEFKELAHLLNIWVISFLIVLAAGAVLVMLSIVSAEELGYNAFKLRCQVALRAHEFESVFAFVIDHLFDAVSDTVLVLFRIRFLHLTLKVKSLLMLGCIVLFDSE